MQYIGGPVASQCPRTKVLLGRVTINSRHRSGRLLDPLRQPFSHRHEEQTVIPPEAFGAAYRLQQKNGQKIAFGKRPAPRAKPCVAATIVTVEFNILLEPDLIRGVLCHVPPQNAGLRRAHRPICLFYSQAANKPIHKLSRMAPGLEPASHLYSSPAPC